MNELCKIIKNMVIPNFINMETAIKTYDRNADCCSAPAWRYVYHALHSADKWFFNPFQYEEPSFHQEGMDNPDNPCSVTLSDEQLLEYLAKIKKKTCDYLDGLSDDKLYEKPENCQYTRLELVLRQFRHLSFHTGMLNGQTVERVGKFPIYVSEESLFPEDGSLFGRYVTSKINIVSLADDLDHLGFICDLLTHPLNASALHLKRIPDSEYQQFYQEMKEALILSAADDELNYIIRKGVVPIAWLKLNGLSNDSLWISMLVVHEKFRNMGVGMFALNFVEEFALSTWRKHIYINTTADNIIAQSLYKKAGYAVVGETEHQNEDGTELIRCTFHKEILVS